MGGQEGRFNLTTIFGSKLSVPLDLLSAKVHFFLILGNNIFEKIYKGRQNKIEKLYKKDMFNFNMDFFSNSACLCE